MLNNITIRVRLLTGFGILILVFGGLILFSINRMWSLSELTGKMYMHPFTVSNAMLRVNTNIIKIHRTMKDVAHARDVEEIRKDADSVDVLEVEVYKDFEIIAERFLGEREMYEDPLQHFKDWKPIRDEVIALMYAGQRDEASLITKGKGAKHVEELEESIAELIDFARNKASSFLETSKSTKDNALKLMYLLVAVVIVSGVIFALMLTRSIMSPITMLRNAAIEVGKGNPETEIDIQSKDEIGGLAREFDDMRLKLKESYGKLTEKISVKIAELARTLEEVQEKNVKLENTQNAMLNLVEDLEDSKSSLETEVEERKQTGERLKESEERYRSMFQNNHSVMLLIDPATASIVDANPAALSFYGYSIDQITGMKITDINTLSEAEVYEEMKRAKEDQRRHFFFRHRLAKGSVRDVEVFSSSVRIHGRELLYSIIHDITERRKLEEQLRQSQKMETVGQLAGGVAHDFNNILAAIINYGHVLLMKTVDEEQKNIIGKMLESADRAAKLTTGLLAFSRKQIIQPVPLKINDIITRIEKLITSLIGEDIEIRTILTDKDSTIMADSAQIEQVLMNLATNARDAMTEGGILTIETEEIEMDDEYIKTHGYGKPGRYALISVTDTGKGMDEETKKKIFEPFFTTKEVGKGTGLGLSILYGIIKQHNGFINVYSEPGEGTTFKIYLPVTGEGAEEVKPAVSGTVTKGTETVLLAEDDSDLRRVTKEILEVYGYKVIEAVNGEDAVEKFKDNRDSIQLLILDAVMPKKSGKKAYDEIRKENPDIKALFISGYTAETFSEDGILKECLNFISKPVAPKELLKKIREVLDK